MGSGWSLHEHQSQLLALAWTSSPLRAGWAHLDFHWCNMGLISAGV